MTSKLHEPYESWTNRWSWWHQFTQAKLEGDGYLVLLCHDGDDGFHLLAVEKAWMLDHLQDFDSSGERYHLFLSAETDDLFTDKRGQGRLSFVPWLVPTV